MKTELNARSAFSFLRGASQPEDMVLRAADLGYTSIAITDHMGFYGSARAHAAAKDCGIRAIVGATLDMDSGTHLPVLVRSRQGYQNLCRFLTKVQLRSRGTAALVSDFDLAALRPDELTGTLCLTGDPSSQLARLLLSNKKPEAERYARSLIQAFGMGNVYFQLTHHLQRSNSRLITLLSDLADHLKHPVVASNSPLYASRQERLMADAFACLRSHTTLDQGGRLLAPNSERYIKPISHLEKLYTDRPEALANATRLAEEIGFTLTDLGYQFPSFTDPDTGKLLTPDEENKRLRDEAFAGAQQRCKPLTQRLKNQIEKELSLIEKLGFAGYFLIVWGIKEFARTHGILSQGRGSAANSVVCYSLGITAVDPLTQNLVFERFLSENRSSWPDIDIDFPSGEQRERVIQHVYQTYAPHGAAMTANVITYRPRSAFREMSKVLGFPEEVANRFSEISRSPRMSEPRDELTSDSPDSPMSKLYPHAEIEALVETIEHSGISRKHARFKPLLHLYGSLLSLPRHLGQHSGGMVISNLGLNTIVPLEPASMQDRTILQWDKDDCEDLGIVKVDLLGLGMLAAMEDTIHISTARGNPFALHEIPLDDPETFALMQRADTIGTFQVESRAQMATLPILKPATFYDVAVEVAIIRPGPIVGDLLHPYLNRRQGFEEVDYIHPTFEPILKRTLGVPLFQEQILEMAMAIADFSGSEADELRRAMAYKKSDVRMQKVMVKLYAAMARKNIDQAAQDKVVASIQSFALYGFPESHAISFGLLAYTSCWIKVHHPAPFYASLINRQPMGFYSASTLIQDAKHHGIRVRPTSVTQSSKLTEVITDTEIRLGLSRIKVLSQNLLDSIISERTIRPFTHLDDFLTRTRPNKKERALLARSGAMNDLPDITHRRHAQWEAEQPLLTGLFEKSEKPYKTLAPTSAPNSSPPLEQMSSRERLAADFATQGHTTGPHPMTILRREHPALASSPNSSHLTALTHGSAISISGLVICRQRPGTAKGHCFISLEDEHGIANIFVPKLTYEHFRLLINTEPFLTIHGTVQVGEGQTVSIYTNSLERLSFGQTLAKLSHDFH